VRLVANVTIITKSSRLGLCVFEAFSHRRTRPPSQAPAATPSPSSRAESPLPASAFAVHLCHTVTIPFRSTLYQPHTSLPPKYSWIWIASRAGMLMTLRTLLIAPHQVDSGLYGNGCQNSLFGCSVYYMRRSRPLATALSLSSGPTRACHSSARDRRSGAPSACASVITSSSRV
jgi:hypothetical protein